MQDRPTASELLEAMGDLLENEVMPALKGPLQHQVRVAANLARVLQRDAEMASGLEMREVELLARVLGEAAEGRDAAELSAALTERLDRASDPDLEQRAWPALLEIVRGKLSIAKPGYDDFDFADELKR
jgi:hypothetical protein